MTKSTHRVDIIQVKKIDPCPNSDNLQIIRIWGFQVVVKKGDFQVGDLAAYVQPDTVVPFGLKAFDFLRDPNHPERTEVRVKVKRLRKQWSQGLLVPISQIASEKPFNYCEGDDIHEVIGSYRYEPPEPPQSSLTAKGPLAAKPSGFPIPTYDIEPLHRYTETLTPGEDVVVTEKIHGSQARYTYRFGVFSAGSKGVWRAGDTLPCWLRWLRRLPFVAPSVPEPRDAWTRVLSASKQLRDFLRAHPGWVVYGEVYGDGIQDMRYGCKPGEIRFAAFQILTEDGFLPQTVALAKLQTWKVPIVPVLYAGPFSVETILPLADGISVMPGAGHIREGVVVSPERQRYDIRLGGPVHLKVVSNDYLERAK